jgi:hypothetical protein
MKISMWLLLNGAFLFGLTTLNAAQDESKCRVHFSTVAAPILTVDTRTKWRDGALWWWISEGQEKFPELCDSPIEKADYIIAWESGMVTAAIFDGGVQAGPPVESGCTPRLAPANPNDRNTPGVPPTPREVIAPSIEGCQASLSDSSITGREQSRTNRPSQSSVAVERLSLGLFRKPAAGGNSVVLANPISTVKKNRVPDPRKSAREMFSPLLKGIQKDLKKKQK